MCPSHGLQIGLGPDVPNLYTAAFGENPGGFEKLS